MLDSTVTKPRDDLGADLGTFITTELNPGSDIYLRTVMVDLKLPLHFKPIEDSDIHCTLLSHQLTFNMPSIQYKKPIVVKPTEMFLRLQDSVHRDYQYLMLWLKNEELCQRMIDIHKFCKLTTHKFILPHITIARNIPQGYVIPKVTMKHPLVFIGERTSGSNQKQSNLNNYLRKKRLASHNGWTTTSW